jgi:hypothetical protein
VQKYRRSLTIFTHWHTSASSLSSHLMFTVNLYPLEYEINYNYNYNVLCTSRRSDMYSGLLHPMQPTPANWAMCQPTQHSGQVFSIETGTSQDQLNTVPSSSSSSSSVICHTTGPQPLLKRFLHLMQSRASSFK